MRRSMLMGIAGGPGSGETTVAPQIREARVAATRAPSTTTRTTREADR